MNRSQQKIIFGISVLVFSIFATDAFAGKKNKSGQNKQAKSIVKQVQNDGQILAKLSPKSVKELDDQTQIIEHQYANKSQEEEKFNSSFNGPKSQHLGKPTLSDQDHLSNNEFTLTEKTNNNIFINDPASDQIKVSFHSAQGIEKDNNNKVIRDEEENMNNIVPFFANSSFDESKSQTVVVYFPQRPRSNSASTPSNKSKDNNYNTNKENHLILSSKSSAIAEFQEQQKQQIIEYNPSDNAQINTEQITNSKLVHLQANQDNSSFEQISSNQNKLNIGQNNQLLFSNLKLDGNISLDKISDIDSSSSHDKLSQEKTNMLAKVDDEFASQQAHEEIHKSFDSQNQRENSHSSISSANKDNQSNKSSSNQSITHQSFPQIIQECFQYQEEQSSENSHSKQDASESADEHFSENQFNEGEIKSFFSESHSEVVSKEDESCYFEDQSKSYQSESYQSESDQGDNIEQKSTYQKPPINLKEIKRIALSAYKESLFYQYKINDDYKDKNITAVVYKLAPQLEKSCQQLPGLETELKESIEEIRKNNSAHSAYSIQEELMKVVNNRYKQVISDKANTANTQLSNNAKFNNSQITHVVSSRIEHNVNLGAAKAAGSDVERQQHSAWSNVFGGFSKDSSPGISSKSSYFGFSLGYELKLEQDLTLGSSFTYAKNTNKYDQEKFNSNNYLFSLYGINQLDQWLLSGAVFGGFGNAKVTREIPGGVSAKGRFNTSAYGAYVRVGYLFKNDQNILMPSIGVSYIYTSQGKYSEHSGSNNIEVSKGRHIISCGDIALKYTRVIEQVNYQLLPSLKVALTRDMYFQGSNPIRENSLVNTLEIKKIANKKHTALVLAPELVFKNGIYELTMLYSLEKSKRFINQLGSFKVKVSF